MDTTLERKLLDSHEFRREYAEESFVIDCMERICEWMDDHGISRAELASRLGTSRANVTQMLRGRNVSLRTLASTVNALDGVAEFRIRSVQSSHDAESHRVKHFTVFDGGAQRWTRPSGAVQRCAYRFDDAAKLACGATG